MSARQLPNVADPPCCKNKFVKHVTFGSFNNISKLSDDTIALWSQVSWLTRVIEYAA